jgi:hypothetical protein
VFVFDDAVLAWRGYGLKRLGFIYECLLALPVTILRGATVEAVLGFARAHGAATIHAMASPCSQLREFARELRGAGAELIAHRPPPFVTPPAGTDLKRFSRYWRAVADQAMRPPPDGG